MHDDFTPNEGLVQRLPLPLAQLYRRAHNAQAPLERHLTAFYLWEATLKLLASVAIVEYAASGLGDGIARERLQKLARPALGHWWEFVRLLLPAVAVRGPAFAQLHGLLLGRARDDYPRVAGLYAALRRTLEGKSEARATVRFTELFDRLVNYRNKLLAHAAPGALADDVHEAMSRALLLGLTEILDRLDVLAGRRLLYVASVRQAGGVWQVQSYHLVGEGARLLPALEVPRHQAARLPDGGRLYLDHGAGPESWRCLSPLLLYDAHATQVLFLNCRLKRQRTEYLCYTTGRTEDRPDLDSERRALLAGVLGMPCSEEQIREWAAQSEAEQAEEQEPVVAARRTLGEFEVLGELGRGAMAVVYRAWQPSLRRPVAVKCLLGAGATAEARFGREVRALGRVDHPHLVRVFTSGSQDDQWFYSMELVEGPNLAEVLARLAATAPPFGGPGQLDLTAFQAAVRAARAAADGTKAPMPQEAAPTAGASQPTLAERTFPQQVAELVRQVADAAQALHEAGVVHRDVKPANIILAADGSRAVLADLGLAQLADEGEGRLTRTRQFVGTLRYASPEQVLAAAPVTAASDVYSLGVTLWEALTLRPMYAATDKMPTAELMKRIPLEEPEPVRQYNPRVPADLEAVVQKCLEKDPRRRYASARALAADLQSFLSGEPVPVRPVGPVLRATRWWVRRPQLLSAVLASAVAVLFLALAAFAWFRPPRVPTPERPLHLLVLRGEQTYDLQSAVPLRNEDRLRIHCDLPAGIDAALFWFDTEGHLTELTPVTRTPGKGQDQLTYPAQGRVKLRGPPGTEFVLLCASRSGPVRREQVEPLFASGKAWPALPGQLRVLLARDRVELAGPRGIVPDADPDDPVVQLENLVEQLRLKLAERFDFLAGVAFAHQEERP
jgi:serine/threonine protein kinase